MKQMVKLAQALVHGPRLLMLDEPTNGLDPPARKRMLDLIRYIRDRGETHIVLSSHLLGDVESVCDEVVILKAGRLAACCDLEAERRANRSFVEMELQRPQPGFGDVLAGEGCEVAVIQDHRFKLVMPPAVTVRRLYELADRARGVDPAPGLQTGLPAGHLPARDGGPPWRCMSAPGRDSREA